MKHDELSNGYLIVGSYLFSVTDTVMTQSAIRKNDETILMVIDFLEMNVTELDRYLPSGFVRELTLWLGLRGEMARHYGDGIMSDYPEIPYQLFRSDLVRLDQNREQTST